MYNKHTQRNNINLHGMECFLQIFIKMNVNNYLNEIE